MSNVQIIPVTQQGQGAFNGGEIVENKPIGFPQDRSVIRPYSNLFYWAHAKAVTDSTIGLHPHQGFEICSFVLNGQIRHYDTQLKTWRTLEAGDVQIIRAGNGISHSEWMGKDAEMFQIWFDPNLQKTLEKPASYDDYRSDAFPVEEKDQYRLTTIVGPGSPFTMDTPGIQVYQLALETGTFTLPMRPDQICSAYVLEGEVLLNGEDTVRSDFALVKNTDGLTIETLAGGTLFMIISPAEPGYPTYFHHLRR